MSESGFLTYILIFSPYFQVYVTPSISQTDGAWLSSRAMVGAARSVAASGGCLNVLQWEMAGWTAVKSAVSTWELKFRPTSQDSRGQVQVGIYFVVYTCHVECSARV